MTGRTLANLLAALVALTSAASIHAQTRDEARADGKDFASELLGEARRPAKVRLARLGICMRECLYIYMYMLPSPRYVALHGDLRGRIHVPDVAERVVCDICPRCSY